jgi:predicted nucleic acid-binding protein
VTAYADTSFLVSLYVQDSFSARAQAWLSAHPANLPLTEFGRSELRNAINRLVFTKALTQTEADAAWQTVETDIAQGRIEPVSVAWPAIFARAEELSSKHTAQLGARTLDVLHVAAAVELGVSEFVGFDSRQGELAEAANLVWQIPP